MHTSLAATVRKLLLWRYMQHDRQQAGKGMQLMHLLPVMEQSVWHDEQIVQMEICASEEIPRLLEMLRYVCA